MRRLGLLALALALTTLGCAGQEGGTGGTGAGSASCASVLEYDGRTYTGHGELRRHPETVGPLGTGVFPGCDDGGGATGPEEVEVVELAALSPARGVLVDGTVFLREGRGFPEEIRSWFTADLPERGSFRAVRRLAGRDRAAQGPLRR